jgi:divalent metal cation (Fe/Co/Zn/Cd) transporter
VTPDRDSLVRRALRLEYLTMAYNVLEGIVAIAAGSRAGSIALIGFGLDSGIEVASALAIVHRFRTKDPEKQDAAERRALKLVGATFFLLAIYVGVESIRKLWRHEEPQQSFVGMALTLASVAWMPFLSRAKRRIAAQLHSRALLADSRETLFCAILSVVVLAGLVANALAGWWWADPVAGLVVVYFLVKEAKEAWSGDGCGCEDEDATSVR